MLGIEIKDLCKSYNNTKVLNDINIKIDKPGVYLLAGPNGSGKTTLLEIITGLRKADSGEVIVNSMKIGSVNVKKELGFLSQQNSLRKNSTVKEELELVKELFNINNIDLYEYLKKFNLEQNYSKKTKHLSGGTKRRLLIAMLFMAQQKIVILDEPVSGLDTFSRDEIWNMVSEYSKNNIVIVSDHYLNQAAQYSDYIYLINEGKIVLEDNPKDIVKTCKMNTLIKVRKEHFKEVEKVLKNFNKEYEVRVSGTVYNIFIDDKHIGEIREIKDTKFTIHHVDFEDVYFYQTGQYINMEGVSG